VQTIAIRTARRKVTAARKKKKTFRFLTRGKRRYGEGKKKGENIFDQADRKGIPVKKKTWRALTHVEENARGVNGGR